MNKRDFHSEWIEFLNKRFSMNDWIKITFNVDYEQAYKINNNYHVSIKSFIILKDYFNEYFNKLYNEKEFKNKVNNFIEKE